MITSPYPQGMASSASSPYSIPLQTYPLHAHTDGTSTPDQEQQSKLATSTAYELEAPHPEVNDPISRYPTTQGSSGDDVEGDTPPRYTLENDPYQLSSRIKSEDEINEIRANTSRKRDGYGPITLNKEARKARKLQGFYENQNENIQRLLTPVDEHVRIARESDGDNRLQFNIAVKGSFIANLVLAVLQVYAAVASNSLSLYTTMADAIFDPMSNVTLIVCNRAVRKVDPRKFPSGKARIETAGNIVFCFLMSAVSWILIVISLKQIQDESKTKSWNDKGDDLYVPAVIAVAIALVTKTSLFLYCWTLRNVYSQIRILWQDHRNDIAVNTFGLITSCLGSTLNWWIDPMGAIILSCVISGVWLKTAWTEFSLLIGVTAGTEVQQWITYIGEV